jgi:DNA helicase-2/ATP-dependent DNA helicase PcrA
MDMSVITIGSGDLIPIEQHFRISAGPGAGKTYWLVNHIENVLQTSNRMGCYKKIACITYTNIAVETIVKRMDFIADRVEVSTIHGFIYANIIKPYMSFIAADYEFDVMRMDGHDEHFISRKKIVEWLNNHPNSSRFAAPYNLQQLTRLDNNITALSKWLSSLTYTINGSDIELSIDNSKAFYMDGTTRRNLGTTTCLNKLLPGLLDYKKLFWRNGVLHHDDVLYFGYILLQKYPFIVKVLRSKFPYFFIDEFQDTSPIQAAILKIIGESETIVGIIGDKAQSIYSFQGADPNYFTSFSLPSIQDYLIADNRRSSIEIINVLNHVRTDIVQNPIRAVNGERVIMYVGDINTALDLAREKTDGDLTVLSRDNITSNALKRQMNSSLPSTDLISSLSNIDDRIRRSTVISSLTAIELAQQKKFKEAIKEMEKNFRGIKDKHERKKTALGKICFLTSLYLDYKSLPLFNFYELVKEHVKADMVKLTKGAARQFYDTSTYEQLAVCVKLVDDDSPSRTIHKSKGDEFDNVLVVLRKDRELKFLIQPPLLSEEQRVFYVAVSRAKNKLSICSPTLSGDEENKIKHLMEVIRIP